MSHDSCQCSFSVLRGTDQTWRSTKSVPPLLSRLHTSWRTWYWWLCPDSSCVSSGLQDATARPHQGRHPVPNATFLTLPESFELQIHWLQSCFYSTPFLFAGSTVLQWLRDHLFWLWLTVVYCSSLDCFRARRWSSTCFGLHWHWVPCLMCLSSSACS